MNAEILATSKDSIAERLQWAIGFRGLSVREFQRELTEAAQEMEVPGTSYAQMHHYLQGRREPTLAVIRLAAELLDVREAWLGFGTGEPTEFREAVGYIDAPGVFKDVVAAVPWLEQSPAGVQSAFLDLYRDWLSTCSDPEGFDLSKDTYRLARSLAALVTVPVSCWGFNHAVPVEYLSTMMTALRLLLPDPGEGHPWSKFDPYPDEELLPLPIVPPEAEVESPTKKRTAQKAPKKKRAKSKRAVRKSKKRGR